MADVLIHNIDDDDLARIDALAAEQGLSRNDPRAESRALEVQGSLARRGHHRGDIDRRHDVTRAIGAASYATSQPTPAGTSLLVLMRGLVRSYGDARK